VVHRTLGLESGAPRARLSGRRYHHIEPDARIVYDYDMWLSGKAHSVSLATVELIDRGAKTQLIFTEQVAFLDGTANADARKHGTAAHLDRIAGVLQT
jgi:uncharacterized protein YndB with AHSA1/START domain